MHCLTCFSQRRRFTRDVQVPFAPRTIKGHHDLPEAVYRPTIVALDLVGYAKVAVRQSVQADIPASRGERESALGGG